MYTNEMKNIPKETYKENKNGRVFHNHPGELKKMKSSIMKKLLKIKEQHTKINPLILKKSISKEYILNIRGNINSDTNEQTTGILNKNDKPYITKTINKVDTVDCTQRTITSNEARSTFKTGEEKLSKHALVNNEAEIEAETEAEIEAEIEAETTVNPLQVAEDPKKGPHSKVTDYFSGLLNALNLGIPKKVDEESDESVNHNAKQLQGEEVEVSEEEFKFPREEGNEPVKGKKESTKRESNLENKEKNITRSEEKCRVLIKKSNCDDTDENGMKLKTLRMLRTTNSSKYFTNNNLKGYSLKKELMKVKKYVDDGNKVQAKSPVHVVRDSRIEIYLNGEEKEFEEKYASRSPQGSISGYSSRSSREYSNEELNKAVNKVPNERIHKVPYDVPDDEQDEALNIMIKYSNFSKAKNKLPFLQKPLLNKFIKCKHRGILQKVLESDLSDINSSRMAAEEIAKHKNASIHINLKRKASLSSLKIKPIYKV
ncbi:conserved Plasmodium protein, unknown function [Plasmodium malariae]|uniref:Uncharacterized protein n=1 Tax=Plasmodium malariae TaxID=5858 RepID=A0A1C3KA65_PLAMA|nr:conserved Plasmodium protein, unknown function [Plasmodium malariae]